MAKEQNFVFKDVGLKFSRFVKNKQGIVLYNKENLIRCIFENANGTHQEIAVTEDFAVEENFVSQDEVRGLNKAYVEDFLADLDATIERGQKRTKMTKKKTNKNFSWENAETKKLLELYHDCMGEIGPLKVFKNKKELFENIAKEISREFKVNVNGQQCNTRLKTLERKKKEVDHHNGETGETRQDAEYEEELDLIATKDDSLEPEVIRGVGYECKFSKSKLKQKKAHIKSRETSQSDTESLGDLDNNTVNKNENLVQSQEELSGSQCESKEQSQDLKRSKKGKALIKPRRNAKNASLSDEEDEPVPDGSRSSSSSRSILSASSSSSPSSLPLTSSPQNSLASGCSSQSSTKLGTSSQRHSTASRAPSDSFKYSRKRKAEDAFSEIWNQYQKQKIQQIEEKKEIKAENELKKEKKEIEKMKMKEEYYKNKLALSQQKNSILEKLAQHLSKSTSHSSSRRSTLVVQSSDSSSEES